MRKKQRMLFIISIVFCSLFVFSCTNSIKFGAVLYDDCEEWIATSFKEKHKTRSEFDKEMPYDYVVKIDNQESFSQAIDEKSSLDNISFEKQMIIVYTFNATFAGKFNLKKTEYKNNELTITYQKKDSHPFEAIGDSCNPYQRWFVLIIDTLPTETIYFKDKNPH